MATGSFEEADRVTREATGTSEIVYETAKAEQLKRRHAQPTSFELADIDHQLLAASRRGVDFVTIRRLAELIGATRQDGLTALRTMLAQSRPDRYHPPLIAVS